MQTQPVTKDLVFRMRLDDQDRERLDMLAKHYSAPAATVLRILVKEKYDVVKAYEGDSFELEQQHTDILGGLNATTGTSVDDIALHLANACHYMAQGPHMRAIPRLLNELRRAGYIKRLSSGYVLTPKGDAVP